MSAVDLHTIVAVIGRSRDARVHRLAAGATDVRAMPKNAAGYRYGATLCGRRVVMGGGWGEDGWDAYMADYRRLGATHEVHVCAKCVERWEGR